MVGNQGLSNSQTLNTVSKMRKTKQDLVMMVGQLDFNYIVPPGWTGTVHRMVSRDAVVFCFWFCFHFVIHSLCSEILR